MGLFWKSGWGRGKSRSGIILGALLAGLALTSLSCGSKTSHGPVSEVTDNTFEKEVLQSEVPVLVDFWAVWCGPCRMAAPMVDKMAEDYKGKLKVTKVDVDHNPGLSQKYNVRAIPTFLIFKKGVIVKNWVGLVPEKDLRDGIQSSL